MYSTVARAKELLAVAENKLTVALHGSTFAARAFMVAITGGLIYAVYGIIAVIEKFTSKQEEAKKATDATRKAFEEYHKAMASKSADLVGRYQKLREEYSKLRTEADKKQWIKDNTTEFNNLSLSVDNLTDADRVFVTNTKNVIKALELRAKALALQGLQMKAYEEYYNTIINADQTVAGGGYYTKFKAGTYLTDANGNLPEEWKKAGVTMEEARYEWGGGQSGMGFLKPTQAAIDKINAYRISQARSTNQRIHSEAQAELDKTVGYTRQQIALTEKELKELDILRTNGSNQQQNRNGSSSRSGSNNDKDTFAEQLATRKGLYEKYLKWITSRTKP